MEKLIFLDTETTGLYAERGDRIIEIGAIEAINRVLTGKKFHKYLNPKCKVQPDAYKIHQLSDEFLADKPTFENIAQEFLDFIQDAKLIIHNAAFDLGFINIELKKAKLKKLPNKTDDTVLIARNNIKDLTSYSLDSLCDYYNIDRSHRQNHGALLDAKLLAEIYFQLTREQHEFDFNSFSHLQYKKYWKSAKPTIIEYQPKKEDLQAHLKLLAKIKKVSPTLW